MSDLRYIVGDSITETRRLPDGSVDLIVTSPPFLALRSYLPADHPWKDLEMGSEATPADFLDTLLALTEEWRRVLAPHGSICVELGDTYSGSTADGGDNRGNDRYPNGRSAVVGQRPKSASWPRTKSLTGTPTLYAWSLAYGRNLLNPGHTFRPWIVRNLLTWCRPNPPVGALGDKVRPATSFVTVATDSPRRYFDLDAVRATEPGANTHARIAKGAEPRTDLPSQQRDGNWNTLAATNDQSGAPPLDWWDDRDWTPETDWQPFLDMPTTPYKGSHYAVFPMGLPLRLIAAMCPRQVCTTCGTPRRRITSTEQADTGRTTNGRKPRDRTESFAGTTYDTRTEARVTTLGWSDCGHNTWRNGMVLDPFAGSGTTLEAAVALGRDATGIDLDARNADLARERCGMFLNVEEP